MKRLRNLYCAKWDITKTERTASAYKHSPSAGFTLMEVIVVLVLVGLISTLLFQGLSYVLSLRVRILSWQEKETTEFLQNHWFRKVVSSMTPGYKEEGSVFSGDEKFFHGLTVSPLGEGSGIPVLIRMNLIQRNKKIILQYTDEVNGETWEIASWFAVDGRFSYLGKEGDFTNMWPPLDKIADADGAAQLPEGILIVVKSISGENLCFAYIRGRNEAKARLWKIFENR